MLTDTCVNLSRSTQLMRELAGFVGSYVLPDDEHERSLLLGPEGYVNVLMRQGTQKWDCIPWQVSDSGVSLFVKTGQVRLTFDEGGYFHLDLSAGNYPAVGLALLSDGHQLIVSDESRWVDFRENPERLAWLLDLVGGPDGLPEFTRQWTNLITRDIRIRRLNDAVKAWQRYKEADELFRKAYTNRSGPAY